MNIHQPTSMPKYAKSFLLFVAGGAVLFNAIFWQEKPAINMLLFALFIIGAIVSLYPAALKSGQSKWLLGAVVASLSMVIIYNSALSCIAAVISILLFTAYSKYQHRSPVYAAGSVLQTYLHFIPQFFSNAKHFLSEKRKGKNVFRKIRIVILPLLLTLIFFFVYRQSSKVFSAITTQIADRLSLWIHPVMNWIEPIRLLFLLLGLLITGGLLHQYLYNFFQKAEATKINDLKRLKSPASRRETGLWQTFVKIVAGKHAIGSLALKYEYKAGVLSLVILNVLLIGVNATDAVYLWLGRAYEPGFQWSSYVHEGAETLIVSILMAMLVVLFFFRANLNFFKGNKTLLAVAYIWLLQNAFLAASVCLRNYYYITYMALTYKRIGVFVFALLVLIGLLSIFLKIRFVKSTYYLVKFNATIGLAVLILSSFIQWDVEIAKYNLSHKDDIPVDVLFLLTLSDHALPVLKQHETYLSNRPTVLQQHYYRVYSREEPAAMLQNRIDNFLQQAKLYSWLSWNLADEQTRKALQ